MSLEVSAYSVSIGSRAIVEDMAFRAEPGGIVALLGPNGAGKSSVLKGFCGLRRARGRVRLDGEDLLSMTAAARARLVGYVAQDVTHLDVQMTVFELLLLAQSGGRRSWRAPPESLARAGEILELLGLSRFADRRPGALSGGERQMIALALALVRRPRLLLLDEPTSALDLANQLQMLSAVERYTREHGVVTLTVLHDLNLATRYAASSIILRNGAIHAAGPTRDVLTPGTMQDVYGVDCRFVDIPGTSFTALFPVAIAGAGSGETAA
ncbi:MULTISPECIES: ABC transporter ATP-binding protein [unclassified Aureimonas]|uniref:ABC transporter ATP-binding protein n=1 Tax=unclassified Aureimonas TaxID=2615206 RepID=UPI0006FDB74F|nr:MULTISPECIES: ABC transporter ATP-binding protein [unclassified Aureimonas]KQT53821.1 hypothetical protein ASG62_11270 [Aureimonas sp. Leaf427]KQT71738.1 hypothetical protein ASG54_19890 [Aureimonas sp. Leaf460]